MEPTHLRYFVAVAECGSFTGGARRLGIAQPTVTVAMKRLEAELGTPLLYRGRNGVSLTAAGVELKHLAMEILALSERAADRVRGLQSEERGRFVIGCPETLGAYFLPAFMRAFIRESPSIELSLWNGASRAVAQAVIDRTAHLGLVVNPLPHPELVLLELFGDTTDLLVARDSAPSGRAAAAERLRRGPLVYVAQLPQSEEMLRVLGPRRLVPDARLTCGTLELVKALALAGVGVAIMPRRVAAYGHPGALRRLSPDLPHIADTIYLAYRADLPRTRAMLRLKDALVAHGRAMVRLR
jgi:DNA-binding transcriptional LysR family regulator